MRSARGGAAAFAVLALVLSSSGEARAQSTDDAPSGYFLTIAARQCPTYKDIRANLARNNIQQSLQDLGLDTPYTSGQAISPQVEASTQPNCTPLVGWKFVLGTGIAGTPIKGYWGSLSVVSGPVAALDTATHGALAEITTQTSVTDRTTAGVPVSGSSIAGAATVELTNKQAALAGSGNKLALQGGTVADPALAGDPVLKGGYAFGALRCAIDNVNGDNVEWVRFPSIKHVYCFAYYVTPPPSSGTIIVRKRVSSPAGATSVFGFQGNVSYTTAHDFTLAVNKGSVPSQTFYRAATRAGDPPWTFTETGSVGYVLTGLDCTAGTSVVTTNRATATVRIDNLVAGDTVDCTFTDELKPQGGTLQISKLTLNGVGTFPFRIAPVDGGATRSATATTTTAGIEADALPGPIPLDAGSYEITESLPGADGGTWDEVVVNCNARPLSRTGGAIVTIAPNTGVACKFTNRFIPDGSITISKLARGASGATGFVVTPVDEPERRYAQSANARDGELVTARGDSTSRLPLGRYALQETATISDDNARWTLTAVQCDGALLPFEQGRVIVDLTEAHPTTACIFENEAVLTPPAPKPTPTPTPTPMPTPTPSPVPPAMPEAPAPPAPRADLVVTKRALSKTARSGQIVSFEVTVANRGDGAAEEAALAEKPRGGQIVSGRPSQGTCDNRAVLVCRLGTLAPGATATVRVRVRATADPFLDNVAVAGSAALDARLRNNIDGVRMRIQSSGPQPRARCAARC